MIGILSNRLSDKFINGLGLEYELIHDFNPEKVKDFTGLFIDWVPKTKSNKVACLKQASLLHKYIKWGFPIVIFDRYMSMTEKETKWCKQFNTYLFEPYLNSGREGFKYLPEWIDDLEIIVDDEDREFDIVYSYHKLEQKLKAFEKWIVEYAKFFPNRRISYSTALLPEFKIKEFKRYNLIFKNVGIIYNEGNFTILLDEDMAYKTGYFNPIFLYAMNLGCLPLLPVEHKYFHSMFKGLIIENIKEMDFYISSFGKFKNELIEEIFDRIKTNWSEFTIGNAIDIISNCYKR